MEESPPSRDAARAPLRALLVEDSAIDSALIVRELERFGYAVTWRRVDEPAALQAALAGEHWDVVLSDYEMPRFNGLDALRLVRAGNGDLPFILVSGRIGEETAVEAIRAGAADYLIKDRLTRLGSAVQRALQDAAERQARRQAEQALIESERRYRQMYEQSPVAYQSLDAQGRILDVNNAWLAELGYGRGDVVGRWFGDFLSQASKQDFVSAFCCFKEAGAAHGTEFDMVRKDGSHIIASFDGVINRAPDGAFLHTHCVFANVTERRQREREMATVARVSAALLAAQTLDEMAPILLDDLMTMLGLAGAQLVMVDAARDERVVSLGRGVWADLTGLRVPMYEEGLTAHVLQAGTPFLDNDIRRNQRLSRPNIMRECRAAAGVPLSTQGGIFGVIWIGSRRRLDEQDMRLLTSIADITASAIQRAALHEQTEERLRHLIALRTIDRAIGGSLDSRTTLGVLLTETTAQLHVDAAAVLLLDPLTLTLDFTAGRGFRARLIEQTRLRLGQGQSGRAALERQTLSLPVLSESDAFQRAELVRVEGFISHHVTPLIAKGQTRGVLEVFQRTRLEPDAEWLSLFEALAQQAAIAIDNAQLFESVQRSNLELSVSYDATIEGWSRALDLRDRETEGHTQRVSDLTVRLATLMHLAGADLLHLRRGALLHDMGKLVVPDRILLKPGPLSEDEWAIMRRHPQQAYDLLAHIAYLRPALDIPLCHHERWDGGGYPRRLAGEQIPLAARIFTVADVWDAMTSDRPYRPALPRAEALALMREQKGKHFDPTVLDAFLSIVEDV